MILAAVGLAAVGIALALRQALDLSTRLMEQARQRAAYIADETGRRLEDSVRLSLARAAEQATGGTQNALDNPANLPEWVTAVFVWEGEPLLGWAGPAHQLTRGDELRRACVGVVPRDPMGVAAARVELVMASPDQDFPTVACMAMPPTDGRARVLATAIEPQRFQTEVLQPLQVSDGELELVTRRQNARSGRWSEPLTGPGRHWVIQPSEAFLEAQRMALMGQTLAFVGLTALALATLLAAMWYVVRVARRELTLAEMKSSFVAGVSHELKTPLAAIRLFAETLQSGRVASEEKRNEYYAIIMRESERLTKLIDNILDFARIEAGRQEYVLDSQDVETIVRETYDAYRGQLDHDGFRHSLTVAEGLPRVDADRDAVAQVLVNLITNAVKYSADEKYLAIDVANDTRRGRRGVLISMQDRGIGIKAEDRARLSEGFFRAADGRVRQKGGTGLGLALVRHIVEAHNGTLEMESRLVKGSTFRVFLPASRST